MAAIDRDLQSPLIRTDHDGISELMLTDPAKYNTLSAEVLECMLTTPCRHRGRSKGASSGDRGAR